MSDEGPREYRYCPRCGRGLVSRVVDPVQGATPPPPRRVCKDSACGFVHYDNPLPVVAAIVEHEGQVVLVRSHGWPEKLFGLVTGFLEKGEDPREGVLRELREELGLEGAVQSLVGVYPFAMRNELIVAYHVTAQGELTLGPELAGFKRVAIEKLRPWPFGTGLAVRDWLRARGFDPTM